MISREQIQTLFDQMVRPLRNRVYTMITRAIIESVNDTDGMQVVKLTALAGETRTGVERFQNFGFSSNPPDESECVIVSVGGNRDHLIVIVADDRATRIKGLAKGDSVQFNARGDKWHLRNSGTLEGVLKKFSVTNDTAELINEITRMAEALAVEPFIVNKVTFADIKTKVESFKV